MRIFNLEFSIFKKNTDGFSIVEVLLAGSLFLIIVSTFIGAAVYGEESTVVAGQKSRAAFLAEEASEAVRNIRDDSFANLTDGLHGLAVASDQWIFSGTSDTTEGFTRQISISTVDANRKEVVSTVTFQETPQRSGSFSITTYLTNWQSSGRGGMIAYADYSGNNDVIRYKILDPITKTWGSQQTVPDFAVPLHRDTRVLKLYASATRDEKILITKHVLTGAGDDTYIYAQVWDGSAWGDSVLLESWAGTSNPEFRDFDGDYLTNGNFLAVYDDDSNTPQYRTWNGTSWSAQAATLDVGGNPDWIVVRSRPGTSEAMVVVRDAGQDTNTIYWNGSSWTGLTEHATDSSGQAFDNIDFKWSTNTTTTGALIFNEASDANPNIRVWNGSTWTSDVENLGIGGNARAIHLDTRPDTNEFLGCFKDSVDDINCLKSDFTPSWTALTSGELATDTDGGNQRSFDFAYEPSGGDTAVAIYSNGGNAAARQIPKYRTYTSGTSTWSSESSLSNLGSVLETVTAVTSSDTSDIMFLMGSSSQTLTTVAWDGDNDAFYSSGGLSQTLQGSSGSVDEDFWFDFVWDKF